MDTTRSLRWAGYYVAVSTLAALVGLAFVGIGVTVGLSSAVSMYIEGAGMDAVLGTAAPGIAVVLLGLLVWKLIAAVAFYKTMTGAVDEEMRERFDSERVKSEILSVLDDRLSDMQYEVELMRKDVNALNQEEAAEEFQFDR